MTRYQLVKLVEWAGILSSRKRLQKVVYLLQSAGCAIESDYTLHHYGPYSQEVARLSDEMVQLNFLAENSKPNQVGMQYSYNLTDHAKKAIADLEKTIEGKTLKEQLAPFEEKAKELLNTDLWLLEVASTLVYFRRQGIAWPESLDQTCKFKNIDPAGHKKFIGKVEGLARQFIA